MKIVVIGGSGLIGSKTVERLRKKGHDVVAASPKSGVNTITGEGLADALEGAQVVVDVANAPSFEAKAVLEFFQTSGRNLFADAFRAKLAQEDLSRRPEFPTRSCAQRSFSNSRAPSRRRAPPGKPFAYPPPIFNLSPPTTSPMPWPTWRSRRR